MVTGNIWKTTSSVQNMLLVLLKEAMSRYDSSSLILEQEEWFASQIHRFLSMVTTALEWSIRYSLSTSKIMPSKLSFPPTRLVILRVLSLPLSYLPSVKCSMIRIRSCRKCVYYGQNLLFEWMLFADSKSLFDVISKAWRTSKKWLVLDIACAREADELYGSPEIEVIRSNDNLADGLMEFMLQANMFQLSHYRKRPVSSEQWILLSPTRFSELLNPSKSSLPLWLSLLCEAVL